MLEGHLLPPANLAPLSLPSFSLDSFYSSGRGSGMPLCANATLSSSKLMCPVSQHGITQIYTDHPTPMTLTPCKAFEGQVNTQNTCPMHLFVDHIIYSDCIAFFKRIQTIYPNLHVIHANAQVDSVWIRSRSTAVNFFFCSWPLMK